VNSLHGCDDAQQSEAWNIRGVEVLRMFDAPAKILLVRMLFERRLVNVEHFAIRAVADGMHTKLKAIIDGKFSGLPNVVRVLQLSYFRTPWK
jgi:hypothetical protein